MNRISFPLNLNKKRPEVAVLHTALLLLGFEISKKERDNSHFGATTRKVVMVFQDKHGLDVTGEVDEKTADLLTREWQKASSETKAKFSVNGAVRKPDGSPVQKTAVRAYDKGLRRRVVLGETKTDADGRYHIPYSNEKLINPERGLPNLLVEAFATDGAVLAASEVCFGAHVRETISLIVEPKSGRNLWDRWIAQLLPVIEDTPLQDIEEKELPFLEKSTRIKMEDLRRILQSARASQRSKLPDWFHFGLLHQGLPKDLNDLLDIPGAKVRKAFGDAVKAAVITAPSDTATKKIWMQFESLQANHNLARPMPGRRLKFGEVFEAAGLKRQDQHVLALALVGRSMTNSRDWEIVKDQTGLPPETIEKAEFAIRVAALTDDHLGVATRILQNSHISGTRDLARLFGPEEWAALVEGTTREDGSDLPEDLEGETPQERRQHYVQRLYDRFAEIHPNTSVIYGLPRRPKLADRPAVRNLPAIMESDPSFNLGNARLDAYLRDHQEALGLDRLDDSEKKNLLDDLKRVQRVYRLRAEPRAVARMLEDGKDSSFAVLEQGRETFIQTYGQELGLDPVREIYRRAEANLTRAMGVLARFHPKINTTPLPPAVRKCPAELKEAPDYATLFGALDGCACEGCESVYSPAAYLTDLLEFVEKEVASVGTVPLAPDNGLEAIRSRHFCDRDGTLKKQPRRPDIPATKLSCRNAETLLPYVDLVLEILENGVAPRVGDVPQTTLTAEQLATQPEHFNEGAYTELAKAVFPFSLPFDLWHEEETIYLAELGTSRAELLETFFPFEGIEAPHDTDAINASHDLTEIERWQNRNIAAARLGLSPQTWEMIASSSPGAAEAWGYDAADGDLWWHPLRTVHTFLERSGLTYEEFLRLLNLKSCNPDGTLHPEFEDLNDCNPRNIKIRNLDVETLVYIHRFLRLQRALNLSLRETDQAVTGLAVVTQHGRPALNRSLLIRLSHLVYLRDKYGLSIPELACWWSHLDTANYNGPNLPVTRSYYETLFLEGRSGDAQFDAFQLNPARSELKNATLPLKTPLHLAAIAGAFGLTVESVEALAEKLIGQADPKLNLDNLSLVARHASLMGAMKLSTQAYLTLHQLVDTKPFLSAGEADAGVQTLRFIQRVELMDASAFSVAELDYLLRQTEPYPSGNTVAPMPDWIDTALGRIRQTLSVPPPSEVLIAILTEATDALGSNPIEPDSDTAETLRGLIEEARQALEGMPNEDIREVLADILNDILVLLETGPEVETAELSNRFDTARALLVDADEEILNQRLAVTLAEELGVSVAVSRILLRHVRSPGDSDLRAGNVLLAAFTQVEPGTLTTLPNAGLTLLLRRLHKAALAVIRFEITPETLSPLLSGDYGGGWLGLAALPVEGEVTEPDFNGWFRLARLLHLRGALLPEQRERLFELFKIALDHPGEPPSMDHEDRRIYAATLEELTGWNKGDLHTLVVDTEPDTTSDDDGGVLGAGFPGHFNDERLPFRILETVTLLRRLGITAKDVSGWVAATSGTAEPSLQVAQIKQALRGRLGDEWAGAAKKLRDPLREAQRKALVDYLLQKWRLSNAAELYDHFLIDTEMTSCMMTSRLIQATAAVQLFVQRVTMNLEPGLALSSEGAEQWEWMKNYRVWEANRKIFLYPENWIEPDLRDDKTPFFKDLENELLQNDITNETAETALVHYLEKLQQVAKLQICGQYLHFASGKAELHVFGRTRDVPHHYYYRRGLLEVDKDALQSNDNAGQSTTTFGGIHLSWTPWERVELDIDGDHLIPVVYNRRLYLFWPTFSSEDEMPFTHLTQQIIELFRHMFRIQTEAIQLAQAVSQRLGVAVIAGMTNGLIQLLDGVPLNPVPDVKHQVREIRKELLGMLGITESWDSEDEETEFDDTKKIFEQVDVPSLSDFGPVFEEISSLIASLEGQLIQSLPAKRLEVQLSWSEFKNDRWASKRTSSEAVTFRDVVSMLFESLPELPGLGRQGVKRLFTFQSEITKNNQLIIRSNIALPIVEENESEDVTDYSFGFQGDLTEIGHFRLNSCKGRLEAVDTGEDISLLDLVGQGFEHVRQQAEDALDILQGDRQLHQSGEPVTPDDDPDPRRRSDLRADLDEMLPQHFLPDENGVFQEDIYRILARHQKLPGLPSNLNLAFQKAGFFYQDASRVFLCFYPWPLPNNAPGKPANLGYLFFPFYHPYACALMENLQRFGIPGIYDLRFNGAIGNTFEPVGDHQTEGAPLQIALKNDDYFAEPNYKPTDRVFNPPNGPRALRPIEEIDFSSIGAYSQYNWEIFFHIPFLIATRLSADQKFREAQRWFHYIFNPTDTSRSSVPQKYWRTRPFVEASDEEYEREQIDELLQMLNAEASTPGLQQLEWDVQAWRNDAFNPHLVARARSTAFQKAVVMRYIDNLIAWGDALFRQETREAVYESIQLYILAAKLLGPQPRQIPRGYVRPEVSYDELNKMRSVDAFSNALVDVESYLMPSPEGANRGFSPYEVSNFGRYDSGTLAPVRNAWKAIVRSRSFKDILLGGFPKADESEKTSEALYFCVPPNEKILKKWDTVADRLFKIRHCQNIEGRKLDLPLLAPPIDPEILVRAKAAGVDVSDILGQSYSPLPAYRFQSLIQKATELCNEVKSLGASLLSALEKHDGEKLALLRNTHEHQLLKAVQGIKEKQIEEAKHALAGLKRSQESATFRLAHYQSLLLNFMNPEETASTNAEAASLVSRDAEIGANWGAAAVSAVPNIKGGLPTTLGTTYGGHNLGKAQENAAGAVGRIGSRVSASGGLIAKMGAFRRRSEDWLLKTETAIKELATLAEQIAAAEIRIDVAEADLENHKQQIKNLQEVNAYMQQKFTSKALYHWMVGQISTLYFQSYQLACDLARKAEQAFAFELGVDSPGIIHITHWDSLKKGLLAGEHLHHDLKRLDVAYLEKNVREYELTKHIPISSIEPLQLIALRETGKAVFDLPEALFDFDFPRHYFRRIKSVSVTIPSITGPYSGVSATLSLQKSRIRCKPDFTGGYDSVDENLFIVNYAATRAVATSSGQNDSGLFELNFRDERYLPFEGEGVVSRWELTMNKDFAPFDFDTISDVVIHLRYTARDGGSVFGDAVVEQGLSNITDALTTMDGETQPLTRLFSVRHEFPTVWAKFKAQAPAPNQWYELALDLRTEHYPFWSHGSLNSVQGVDLWVRSEVDPVPENVHVADKAVNPSNTDALIMDNDNNPEWGRLFYGSLNSVGLPERPNETLTLYFDTNAISDLWIAVAWSR